MKIAALGEPGQERTYRERLQSELLEIACRILTEEGLAALQARRVAKEAGCAVGTIYNVFGDLDGLILAANEATLDMMGAPLTQALAASEGRSTTERLLALATAYMEFARDHARRWRSIFEHRLAPSRELPEHYVAKRANLLALIEETIAPELPRTEVRKRAARALLAAVHGIITLAFDNKLGPFDADETAREIRFIVTAAAAGLKQAE